jgi:hypothetical protein
MLSAIPALPVCNVERSTSFYRDVLELTMRHSGNGFAIFHRDSVELHLWQADDESCELARTKNRSVLGLNLSFLERQVAALLFRG